ncbi:hypothetical protein ACIQZI_13155 [Peribacillus sp. NPDC096379]
MLNLYRYMIDNNMKKLEGIPNPYRRMLEEEGYTVEEAPTVE